MAVTIRPAEESETDRLSELARQSKAHWGYDRAFMAACREELTVAADQIAAGDVWVAMNGADTVGFYCLSVEDGRGVVELFFVRPDAMGIGVGRALWIHLADEAKRRGAERVDIESDPQAEGFYRAMGCRRIGEAPSVSIPGRVLPRLEFRLSEPADA